MHQVLASMRFRPALWPTIAATAGIALTLALAVWQLGRGNDKAALAQRILAANRAAPALLGAGEVKVEDMLWRRVEVSGRFEPKYAVFIDNRVSNRIVGYHVVMPLKIADSDRYVLVNRGWIAGTGSRGQLPHVMTPTQVVRVVGLATAPSKRFLELSTSVAEGNVWQNLTLDRYRAAMPIAIQPLVIEQESDSDDGLIREWGVPDMGIQTHYGYAFQWFALAATILIFYLAVHVRKRA